MRTIFALAAVLVFMCQTSSADVFRKKQTTECLKLTDANSARAHGLNSFYDNISKKRDQAPKQVRFWYNEKEWTFTFKDESDAPAAVWELHIARKDSDGDLLILSAGTDGKLAACHFGRRKGGMPNGKKQTLANFGSIKVKSADDVRTVTVKIPSASMKPFAAAPGSNGGLNCFYLVSGEKPGVSAWNPTGSATRTLPWCLGRVLIMK